MYIHTYLHPPDRLGCRLDCRAGRNVQRGVLVRSFGTASYGCALLRSYIIVSLYQSIVGSSRTIGLPQSACLPLGALCTVHCALWAGAAWMRGRVCAECGAARCSWDWLWDPDPCWNLVGSGRLATVQGNCSDHMTEQPRIVHRQSTGGGDRRPARHTDLAWSQPGAARGASWIEALAGCAAQCDPHRQPSCQPAAAPRSTPGSGVE